MAWIMLLGLLAQDLPAVVTKRLESLRAALKDERAAAGAELLETFDEQLKMLGNMPGITAEQRLAQMEAVQGERDAFENAGALPFSAGLRAAAKQYLGRVLPAEVRLMRELDRAAMVATRQGNVDLARELLDEKDGVPTIVARFRCTYHQPNGRVQTWDYNLFSDGTANRRLPDWELHPKTWSVGPKNINLVVINVTPESPKGGFKDVCTLDPDGRGFDAGNQLGAKYRAVRID